jgi:uncharacterized membrane protein
MVGGGKRRDLVSRIPCLLTLTGVVDDSSTHAQGSNDGRCDTNYAGHERLCEWARER